MQSCTNTGVGLAQSVHSELASIVGPRHVLTDPDITAEYCRDTTGRFGCLATVVRPLDTNEVSRVVSLLAAAGILMVPQGGNTGLVGGGVPSSSKQVVVSTRRIGGIETVAPGYLLVGAGTTLAEVQQAALDTGYCFPLDIGSRDSATIGGMVATNAGGVLAYRFGHMGHHVAGIEVVLPDGRVISHLSGLDSDNTGYRWPELFTGSEGTLGIITRVLLWLSPPRPFKTVALASARSLQSAVEATVSLRDLPCVEAVELINPAAMEFVCESLGLSQPLSTEPAAYLLIAASGRTDPTDELGEGLSNLMEAGLLDEECAMAEPSDEPGRDKLWRYRHGVPEACNRHPPVIKLDVTIPLDHYAEFIKQVEVTVTEAAPDAQVVLFGHLSVGNVHVNVLDSGPAAGIVERAVLGLVARYNGSVSSEHGVGHAKAPFLHLTREAEQVKLMRTIKAAFDPQGVMNPGIIFASESQA